MKKLDYYFNSLYLVSDFLAIILAFFLNYFFRQTFFVQNILGFIDESSKFMSISDFSFFTFKSAILFMVINCLFLGYSFNLKDRFKSHFYLILKSFLVWSNFCFLYFLLIRIFPFSRSVFLVSLFSSLFLILIFRKFLINLKNYFASLPKYTTKVLLIASDLNLLSEFYKSIKRDNRFQVVAIISASTFDSIDTFNTFEDFVKSNAKVDLIIDLNSDSDRSHVMDFAKNNQVDYSFIPYCSNLVKNDFKSDFEHNFFKLNLKRSNLNGWNVYIKRFIDIIVSFLLICILSPVFLVVSVLIKLDSKGPVFFVKDDSGKFIYRVGLNKKKFVMYKFRTMTNNSHSSRYSDLSNLDLRKNSPLVKIKNDPRITKLGKFLRRFDIDELPQLFNVLKGDMSLVGPRPHLEEEVKNYSDHHNFVFTIRPGITGLPQISGRSDLCFEKEVELDTNYIQNWSVFLDLKILLKTPFVVFMPHGEQGHLAKK